MAGYGEILLELAFSKEQMHDDYFVGYFESRGRNIPE